MNTTSKLQQKNTQRHVGIDVGKSFLDICIYETNEYFQVDNTPTGIRQLVNKIKRYKLTRVLVEATGGYERAVVEACAEQALPIIIVTPIKVRQFAHAQGILAKTDKMSYSQIWCMANQAASCSTLIPSLNFTPSMTSANRL